MDNLRAPSALDIYGAQTASESSASGVSWSAVIGGAFVATSLALVLTILGVGLGLSSVSPWAATGASAPAIGTSAIVWIIVTQAIAAALGGYLTGRLRTKWTSIHTDEVYFRDTAHGFLVWAVGVVITVAFLASAATSIVGTAAKLSAATAAGATAMGADVNGTALAADTDAPRAGSLSQVASTVATSSEYLSDSLLRSDRAGTSAQPAVRSEVGRIMAVALHKEALSDADRSYAAQVIASQTGLSQQDAQLRVDAVYAQAKSVAADAELTARNAADDARRVVAKTSLWIFVALLIGAFCASLAATIGGRQGDGLVTVVHGTPS